VLARAFAKAVFESASMGYLTNTIYYPLDTHAKAKKVQPHGGGLRPYLGVPLTTSTLLIGQSPDTFATTYSTDAVYVRLQQGSSASTTPSMVVPVWCSVAQRSAMI